MPSRAPGRKFDRLAASLCGALALVYAEPVDAQSPESTDTVARSATGEPLPQATDGLRRMPVDAFRTEPDFGVRYRSIFRDTGAPYINEIRPVHIEPTA